MRPARLALPLALLALGLVPVLLAPVSSWAAGPGSGGALAETLRQGDGGGGVAPSRPRDARASELEEPSGAVAPSAAPAQEEEPTPTTPEGEQQPSEETPAPQADEELEPAPAPPGAGTEAIPAPPAAESAGAVGFLPTTGMEVAALAAIGVGLLLAGFALRPRRRVPAGTKRPDTRRRVTAGGRR